jgi:glutaredoxin
MRKQIKTVLLHCALMTMTAAVAVAVGSQAPKWFAKLKGPVMKGDFAAHVANQPQKLTLYGTTTCRYCVKAREYLHQAGIAFNDQLVDTSAESQNRFSQLNQPGVPVLVSSKGLISGFNPVAYDELAMASAQQ